jgi:chemotaxis protein MotB
MKRIILLIAVITMAFYSCKPIYQCGHAIPEKKPRVSRRALAVIEERDDLCETLASRDAEIRGLKSDIAGLNSDISGLNSDISGLNNQLRTIERRYQELNNDKLSQAERFDLALKQKSNELTEKERLLLEREKVLADLQKRVAHQDSITRRLNDVLRNALLGFKSDELSVEIKNGKVYVSMSDNLLFRSGSAAVETKGREALKVLAGVLNNNPDINILVEGHTDNIPIRTAVFRDNWDLSVARATSIVRILTDDHKIVPDRLTASGKGEFAPRSGNDTAEGRAANRRTDIILSPRLDEIMQLLN